MNKPVSSFLALLALVFLTLPAHAAWNASWTHRVKVTLNSAADGAATQAEATGVPVLIRLHTGNFPFIDAKPDGSDLRFIAADDKTPLKFHIEKFDGVNELALMWVQVPRVAPGSKADFVWLYYGNPNAPPAADAKTTYDAAQALVYHFGDAGPLPQDATANANHATRATAKASAAGLIGGGAAFDGNSEIALPATPSMRGAGDALTVSMWIKPTELGDARLIGSAEANAAFGLSVRGGKLAAQAGAAVVTAGAPLAAGTWQHVALVVKDGLVLYLNGQEVARATGAATQPAGALVVGSGFKGELDELQVATTARSGDWIRLAAAGQGPESRLASIGAAEGGEEAGGTSYLRILLGAVTLDGWIVIGILAVMFVISIWVMASKAVFVSRVARDNNRFMQHFNRLVTNLRPEEPGEENEGAARYPHSQLARLYAAGVGELRQRFTSYRREGRELALSVQSLDAIRATVEARVVREGQRLNSSMVLLTISIAGGPFLGLLGTVVGVMITFAAIAAAGDVNVNAIAPGIAAALVATVAGLAVAIPALFGYNYLTGRIQALTADMQVFVDELTTRLAESHSA